MQLLIGQAGTQVDEQISISAAMVAIPEECRQQGIVQLLIGQAGAQVDEQVGPGAS